MELAEASAHERAEGDVVVCGGREVQDRLGLRHAVCERLLHALGEALDRDSNTVQNTLEAILEKLPILAVNLSTNKCLQPPATPISVRQGTLLQQFCSRCPSIHIHLESTDLKPVIAPAPHQQTSYNTVSKSPRARRCTVGHELKHQVCKVMHAVESALEVRARHAQTAIGMLKQPPR
eukprot:6211223-Pleurochrysis_carterae.AAC.3